MEIGRINGKTDSGTVNSIKNKGGDDEFERRLKSAMDNNDEKELKKVCREFEGIMLNMMYKQMKATVPRSELIPDDSGREMFQTMLDDKLVEEASKDRTMGLGDVLYKQLSRQSKSKHTPGGEGGNESAE